ncbi:hypothetical protein ACFL1N_05410 [Thermodesulfobacteriota bacterium]
MLIQKGLKIFIFSVDYFIFYSSIPLVFFTILLLFAVWKMLSHPDLKRMLFLKDLNFTFTPEGGFSNAIQLNEMLKLRLLSDRIEKESTIENLFYKVIKGLPYLNISRSIAGRLYSMLDRYYTLNERYFRTSFLIKIIITTLLIFSTGYYLTPGNFGGVPASDITTLLILVILCMMVCSVLTPVSHNHLLPKGRSDQFLSSIIVWLIHPMAAIIWTLVIIILSWVMGNHMPDFTLAGFHFKYHPLESSLIIWPLVIVPVLDTFWYCTENLLSVIIMILFIAILITLSIFSLLTVHIEYRIILIAISILLANGFFINRLRRYWFRKDIVLFI